MSASQNSMRWWLPVATTLVVGGAAGALWLAQGASGQGGTSTARPTNAQVAAAMKQAGCRYRTVPPLPPTTSGNFHGDSPTLRTKVKWSTFPPSAGGHHDLWSVWGFYRKAVNPRKVVHNLEHGGVIIWWGPKVSDAAVDRLQAFYKADPDGMLGTPIAGLGSKVALTAWTGNPKRYFRNGYYGLGKTAVCPHFDQAAFAVFREAFRGVGPEGIPQKYNKPGMGP